MLTFIFTMPTFAAKTDVMPMKSERFYMEGDGYGLILLDSNDVLKVYTFGTNSSKYTEHIIADNVKEFSVDSVFIYYIKNDGKLWRIRTDYKQDDYINQYTLELSENAYIADNIKRITEQNSTLVLNNYGEVFRLTSSMTDVTLNYVASNAVDIGEDRVLFGNALYYYVPTGQNEDLSLNFELELGKEFDFSGAKKYYNNHYTHFVLCENGDLWSWGDNQCGRAGHGDYYDDAEVGYFLSLAFEVGETIEISKAYSNTPRKILTEVKDLFIDTKNLEVWAIKDDNTVWHWGDGKPINALFSSNSTYSLVNPTDFTGYSPHEDIFPEYFEFYRATNKVRVYPRGQVQYRSDYEHFANSIATREQILKGYTPFGTDHSKVPELIRKWPDGEWANLPECRFDIYLTINGQTLKDVKASNYFYDSVEWALENGVTKGTSALTFSPDNLCTHAEILTFLWRSQGSPVVKKKSSDNTGGEYWTDAYLWAVENEIVSVDDYSLLEKTCSRAETVEYLWKLAGKPGQNGTVNFEDVSEKDSFSQAVLWAVKNKITSGTSENSFSPNEKCSRGQIVTFLYRYLNNAN